MAIQPRGAPAFAQPAIDAVRHSFARALVNGLLDRFYEVFLSHREIAPLFAKTDRARQKEALRHGLTSILKFAENDPLGAACLKRIRKSHSRDGLNIDPALYTIWIDSLFQALRECDPGLDADTERTWQGIVERGVESIKSGY